MIDWSTSVPGWEIVLSASVQVAIVLFTALLTWLITRASERTQQRQLSEAEYWRQIEDYYREVQDLCDILLDATSHQGSFVNGGADPYVRWSRWVTWLPRRKDRVVDAWVRTQLFRIPGQFKHLTEEDLWDELAEQQLSMQIQSIAGDLAEWIDGRKTTAWFEQEYREGSSQVWMGRIGHPLEEEPPIPGRARRLGAAARQSALLLMAAWVKQRA